MATVLLFGNPTLLSDAPSLARALPPVDRSKPWGPDASAAPAAAVTAAVAGRARRAAEPLLLSAAVHARGFRDQPESPGAGDAAARRRRGAGSKVGAVGGGGGGGGGEGEGDDDWEEELRSRLKELEEMKELEKRAEELQSRVAREQAERRATAKLMFELGQKAYGKGMYARAIEFLEAALTIIPSPSLLGGEIQIWLAMAYEANNRHRDCIALYQQLEKSHPSVSIRRQAAELRYILQAPKLKISKDEMVTIPLIGSSYDRYAGTWSDKNKDRDMRRKTTSKQVSSAGDFWGDFMFWRPPSGWEKNRSIWVIVSLWICLLGTALLLQR
ncbi:hypothetical protein ACMD2_03871 [Ananas comosus]|uniref:Uncharacterized protein n=1 Tax=Ananas comosus TaxID=4615 RepID=A0A199W6D8_ANACO|nr:hypothetical protein ACMD2_03871 [Ananas comosus]